MKKVLKYIMLLLLMLPVILLADGNGPGISPNLKFKIINKDGWITTNSESYNSSSNYEKYEEINKKYIISKEKAYELISKNNDYNNCFNKEKMDLQKWIDSNEIYYYFPYQEIIEISFSRYVKNINASTELMYPCYKDDFAFSKDLQPISDTYEVTEKDVERYSRKQTEIVINENGTKIYAGPFYTFKELDTIPFATKFEVSYHVRSWEYVTYNGISGWIYSGDIAYKKEKKAIIGRDTIIYNINDKNDQKKIDKNTIIDEYYSTDSNEYSEFTNTIYYSKDDYFAKIDDFAFEPSFNGNLIYKSIIIQNDINLYSEKFSSFIIKNETFCEEEEYNCNEEKQNKYAESKKIDVIPKGTKLNYKYGFDYYYYTPAYYVEYNGKSGWIYSNDNSDISFSGKIEKIYEENDNKIEFNNIYFKNEKAKLGDKIFVDIDLSDNTKIITSGKIRMEEYYFDIKYDEKEGYYIILNDYDYIKPGEYSADQLYLEIDNTNYKYSAIEDKTNKIEIYEELKNDDLNQNEKQSNELTIYQIIIISGIGVLILVLTSIVTILLINRKKRNKNEKDNKEK